MADKADEFLKRLEAGDIIYVDLSEKEVKEIVKLLTLPENKKKSLDSLVAAAKSKIIDAREAAAPLLDAIGDKDATRKVAEFYMPLLDTEYGEKVIGDPLYKWERLNRRQAVEIFERMRWPPAAEHELSLIAKGGMEDKDFIQLGATVGVILKSDIAEKDAKVLRRHEDIVLEAAKKTKDLDLRVDLFAILSEIGTRVESAKLIKDWIGENKNSKDSEVKYDVMNAREGLKQLERRIGVSSKPAEGKIKDSMEGREKKPVTVK